MLPDPRSFGTYAEAENPKAGGFCGCLLRFFGLGKGVGAGGKGQVLKTQTQGQEKQNILGSHEQLCEGESVLQDASAKLE